MKELMRNKTLNLWWESRGKKKREFCTFAFDFVHSVSTTKIFADDVDAP